MNDAIKRFDELLPGFADFHTGYTAAAEFFDADHPDAETAGAPWSAELKALCLADCLSFWIKWRGVAEQTAVEADQMGHDFWLTRNRHGAGFWDRGALYRAEDGTDFASVLTADAEKRGPVELYLSDAGEVCA